MIDATPSGNSDITSLLRTNPAVKFSNTNRQSTTMGEIDPAQISINGAKFYQNNFMIDGFNMNNDIDPANKSTSPSALGMPSGVSQGMAIDSDFVESVDVYDSDVSAKYGGFTGGVIDAKTRNPRSGFHGKISMSHTRDSWTKQHVSGEEVEEFLNSTDASNQPKFEKYTTRLNLEGFLTDDFGLMFGYTNTRSKIPLYAFSSNSVNDKYTGEKKNQRREINNYFLKALWFASDRLTITPSIIYAPQENKVFHDNALDSYQYHKSGGLTLNLDTDYEFDFGVMKNKLSYQKLETSRDAEHEYRYGWKVSNLKPWGKTSSNEGGWGDIEQSQKTFRYNLDFDLNEIEFLGLNHKFITGFELSKTDASFEITKGFKQANNQASLNGATCDANDEFCLNDDSFNGKGQYFLNLSVYNKGKINVKQKQWAFYLEDKIKADRFTFRPGVRFGGDDYMDKKTLSPRFSMSYDVFNDDNTVISFGKNRYHGRNIFAYRLKDGQNSLLDVYKRDKNAYTPTWTYHMKGLNSDNFHRLKIPYDDETSFGIKQKISNYEINFKHIDRKGRNQIMLSSAETLELDCKDGSTKSCRVYSNGGYSNTKNWSISLKNIEPFKILSSNHSFELSYDYSKTKTNARDYTLAEKTNTLRHVYYNGKFMTYDELPIREYGRPWELKLTTISHIPNYNLTLSNFFALKGSTEAMVNQGSMKIGKETYSIFEDVKLGRSFSWDTRIGYTHKLPKDISVFVNLDIYNVLDRVNKSSTASELSKTLKYENGRQFWLEAGIKW